RLASWSCTREPQARGGAAHRQLAQCQLGRPRQRRRQKLTRSRFFLMCDSPRARKSTCQKAIEHGQLMNEVNNATHPEANVLPTLEAASEPPVPGDADYEAAKCALEHNVAQDMRDPLLHLSDETLATLESLAYHNIGALTRLERTIKDAIVEANQGESRARA